MKHSYYITTAIPYVNAKPHIGFALELIQTDVLARYHRLLGDDTYFLTGTDDNSLKNVQAAEAAGKATADFVEENAGVFDDLTKRLSITNDQFIRTASEPHFAGAQKLWAACKPEDIYKKKYRGLYCVGCEVFYAPEELIDGRCPEHKTIPEEIEEENYFFKLSNYQKQLEDLIESDTYRITPQSRKNEVLSFVRMGLEDFSISRSAERAKNWGVPVPGDPSQIMYVWFDALSNYITALGYGDERANYKKYWEQNKHIVHVVGKGIIRFHAVYWPAMLLSAGVRIPSELFVHGYINVEGMKMSKSIGNVVDPFALIDRYGSDAVRYFLLRHMHPVEDSDFSETRFIDAFNADLANGLGNLVSRVTNMIEHYLSGSVGFEDKAMPKLVERSWAHLKEYRFREALQEIWQAVTEANQLIDKKKPWELVKHDAAGTKKLLEELITNVHDIAVALKPFMPETAEKVLALTTAKRIVKAEPLFGKLKV